VYCWSLFPLSSTEINPLSEFRNLEGAVTIEEVSAAELRKSLDAGAFTIRQLVQACLDRIAAMDKTGPTLNAVIELNPDALTIADALDAELTAGTIRGPLHGIPVLLKDNIATADGMENTAGSLALVGAKPIRDAFITTRLRNAGAVILGKTNLSEWANIRDGNSSDGWSGRGGQTVNPYRLDRNPSGSSSGSGVAAAASYAPLTVGTETNGSIVSPSSASGIVGLKPTVGLVSRSGIIPISHSQDTAGPMTRTVMDAAMLLNVLAAPDLSDPAHLPTEPGASTRPGYPTRPAAVLDPVDYVAGLDLDALVGARIGVIRQATGFTRATGLAFESALKILRDAGVELIDPVEIANFKEIESSPVGLDIMLWELKPGLAAYLRNYTESGFPIRTIDDIISFNEEHADLELPYFDQSLFVRSAAKTDLDDPAYIGPVAKLQQQARAALDTVLDQHHLDALVAPTSGPATKIDLVNGEHGYGGSCTLPAIAGYPLITVPAGYHFGLPIGISFIGRAWSEATLLRLGHAFEQVASPRRPPQYLPGSVIPAE
jgi:amidase